MLLEGHSTGHCSTAMNHGSWIWSSLLRWSSVSSSGKSQSPGGFQDPNAESVRTIQVLTEQVWAERSAYGLPW